MWRPIHPFKSAIYICTGARADINCTREPVGHGNGVLLFAIGHDCVEPNTANQGLHHLPLCIPRNACIAGALNPAGMYLVALSAAAATFGGTSGLVWMHNWLKDTKAIPLGSEPEPPPLYRSYPCLVAAAFDAALFVVVLGPGVP